MNKHVFKASAISHNSHASYLHQFLILGITVKCDSKLPPMHFAMLNEKKMYLLIENTFLHLAELHNVNMIEERESTIR